jgi:hypothetical protein
MALPQAVLLKTFSLLSKIQADEVTGISEPKNQYCNISVQLRSLDHFTVCEPQG